MLRFLINQADPCYYAQIIEITSNKYILFGLCYSINQPIESKLMNRPKQEKKLISVNAIQNLSRLDELNNFSILHVTWQLEEGG